MNDVTPIMVRPASMAGVDLSPLLPPYVPSRSTPRYIAAATAAADDSSPPSSIRVEGFRQAARLIRRASRGLRRPSAAVRETAAQEIEDFRDEWAYSLPVVVADFTWNAAFIAAAFYAVVVTWSEVPPALMLWITGYVIQCVVHTVCVAGEFLRRRNGEESSVLLINLESANTVFSFLWWMLGFSWLFSNGLTLQQESPTLYWLCVGYLVLDLFFVMFCVALASLIAVGVCCCLPCIIALLYFLSDRVGASIEDIDLLPKYTFHWICNEENANEEAPGPCEGIMKECGTNNPTERRLTAEDAECCICLSAYEDDAELRELPCQHHFHCTCVDKWLYINSTCPLCKYDISERPRRDEAV